MKLQTLFRSLIENSFDVIEVVDREGTTLYASPSSEFVLGYKPAELVGTTTLSPIVARLKKRGGHLKQREIQRLEDALQTIVEEDIESLDREQDRRQLRRRRDYP